VYHILNRSVAGRPLFRKRADYQAFERNRTCIARSRPYGSEEWQNRQADDLGWWHTLRREGDGEAEKLAASRFRPRPLETALLSGKVDAIYTQTGPFQRIQEQTGKIKAIENLADYPDWTLQGANVPATLTVTDVACEKHPELIVALLKGLIKVGRWANEQKRAAAVMAD
jgi:ABC-type nitrate/sulfonate/bicarbonate transport system substrate-binding protein